MTEDENSSVLKLGDKIRLTGFSTEDGSTMVVVKKMVGNYVKRIMDAMPEFQDIAITLKKIHPHPDGKGGKNEIHVKVTAGKVITSEVVDFNLFVGLDLVLKKILAECS